MPVSPLQTADDFRARWGQIRLLDWGQSWLTQPDGVLIETDRLSTPGPTPGVDLWWSGKHANHGGNVRVITVPDGWPIWTSDVRPGREHDTTALQTHAEILPALAEAAGDLRSLGDFGYEGKADTITVAFKKPKDRTLTGPQQKFNKAHNGVRLVADLL